MSRRFALGSMLALAIAAPAAGQEAVAHRRLTWQGAEVHVLTVSAGARVEPVAAQPGRSVPAWARSRGAVAAINGGYFNHSDGAPVSHVVLGGRPLTDPRRNRALVGNPQLQPVLPLIFDRRVEWRHLSGPEGAFWAIAPHAEPAGVSLSIRHALQAGPALLPTPALEAEGFVSRDARGKVVRDGIASASRAARSALGLTEAGDMLLVATTGSAKGRTGLSIAQLAALMAHLGAQSAMALDGGSSTTLSWRNGSEWATFTGHGQAPARVNSALVVMP